MMPLPFDYSRCEPTEVDSKCRNCKRWWDHPKQVNSEHRQSFVRVANSRDRSCIHIPISHQENT